MQNDALFFTLGDIHKPRGQLRWRGVSQMTILLHKPYLVKATTKGGGGGQKYPKFWPRGLWMIPKGANVGAY